MSVAKARYKALPSAEKAGSPESDSGAVFFFAKNEYQKHQ